MFQDMAELNFGDYCSGHNMKIEELIQIVSNKRNTLNEQKNSAFMSGRVEDVLRLEDEIKEVEKILEKLQN